MPIAIPDFVGGTPGDAEVGAQHHAGHHRQPASAPACSRRSIRRPSSRRSPTSTRCRAFADWRAINAQALVTGRITRQGDGRLKAEFRLWDVSRGQQLDRPAILHRRPTTGGASRTSSPTRSTSGSPARRAISTPASCSSTRPGPKEQRVKRLAIMDQDGANVRYLTRGDDLVLTPRFSPSTQEITYMSYGQRRSARLSAQHRDRPARDRRQFPRHDASRRASRPTASA